MDYDYINNCTYSYRWSTSRTCDEYVEKPDYKVIQTEQNIEIRQYEPMIIAEVEVDGKREDAIRDGFRLIADYI